MTRTREETREQYTSPTSTAPVVVGFDGYDGGRDALEAEVLRGMLHEAVADLPSEARALPVFMRGFAAQELVEASEAGVDLLVLGSRGGGPLRRRLHHSVTSTVMQDAKCPVLISPAGVKAPTEALV
jgi:nucleotide-binding universal stress UspA family protein